MSDHEIDVFMSDNMNYLLDIFTCKNIATIILRNGNLPLTYNKFQHLFFNQHLSKVQYVLKLKDLHLKNLITIDNLEQISTLMGKLNNKPFSLQHYTYNESNTLKENLADQQIIFDDFLLRLYQTLEVNFRYNHSIYTEPVQSTHIQIINKENFLDKHIEYHPVIHRYSTDLNLSNPTLSIQYTDFKNLKHIISLAELNYNFNYFARIPDIESFEYLYHQTNFKKFFDNQLTSTENKYLFTYIYHDLKLLQHVVDNYLIDYLPKLFSNFVYDETNFKIFKYLIEIGYNYNNIETYRNICDYDYDDVRDLDDVIDYLLTLNLSQENLTYLHIHLSVTRPKYTDLLDKIYNQIDEIKITDKIKGIPGTSQYNFSSMTDKLFKQILAKIDTIDNALDGWLTSAQVKYILNQYDNIDHLKILEHTIDHIAHEKKYGADYIDLDDMLKIIDHLYAFNYLITYEQLQSIYNYEYYRDDFDYTYNLVKKIVMD